MSIFDTSTFSITKKTQSNEKFKTQMIFSLISHKMKKSSKLQQNRMVGIVYKNKKKLSNYQNCFMFCWSANQLFD